MLSPSSPSSVMLRPACADDAPFIAAVVMEALGSDVMSRLDTVSPDAAIVEVCRRTDTLYSWCNTCIAAFPDGRPAGALVAYRGENYRQMQRTTFAMLRHLIRARPDFINGRRYAFSSSTWLTPSFKLYGGTVLFSS